MENLGLIIAIVSCGFALVGCMICLFLWNRGEANNDRRKLDADMKNLYSACHSETNAILKMVHEEIKDFHTRLCVIEERRGNRD